MHRRRLLTATATALGATLAGCSDDEDTDAPSVPTDEDLRQQARDAAESEINTGDNIDVLDHTGTPDGNALDVEFTIENVADEPLSLEIDIGGYDQTGSPFYDSTDEAGTLDPGATMTKSYTIDPADHDDVSEVIAYTINVLVL